VPLVLGVLLSDLAYTYTYEVQWKNFASWLIVAGLLFGGLTLLGALIELPRMSTRGVRKALYPAVLLLIWVLGFINALIHAADAWASIPAGPILSGIVAVLAMAAIVLRFYDVRSEQRHEAL
jgi:uncharacterized membrane protein